MWQRLWDECECAVVGDARYTRALRICVYQLLIAANQSDPRVNIGANALTGERYRGHAFWDTEVFMLPFFIYTQPETARALLLYRYHTLDGARRNARDGGFRGARYAWESADTGLYRKTKVRVSTLNEELVVWVYVLDAFEGGLPSATYLGTLADAAEAADAPADYVAALRSRPCRSNFGG